MGITVFLLLDDALVLVKSYTQAMEKGQRVVQFTTETGFCAEPEKVPAEAYWKIYTS